MSVQAVSIRRALALLTAIVLAAAFVLALLMGRAEGKPAAKCAPSAEQAGCKLPVGASFRAEPKTGSATGYVTVQVTSRGISVGVNAYIDCKRFDPSNGNQSGTYDSYSGNQRPQVGKTYEIKDSATERDEEGIPSTTDAELTLVFKSAKQVVVTLHQVSSVDGKLSCDGSKTWTLKRQ